MLNTADDDIGVATTSSTIIFWQRSLYKGAAAVRAAASRRAAPVRCRDGAATAMRRRALVHWSLERLVFWGPNFLYTPKEARGSAEQERVLSLSAMSALSFAKQCMSKAAVQQLSSKLLKTDAKGFPYLLPA